MKGLIQFALSKMRCFAPGRVILALFVLVTMFMGYKSRDLFFIDAGFEKLLPLKHPFMQTFLEYQSEFGGANQLLSRPGQGGDIFTRSSSRRSGG